MINILIVDDHDIFAEALVSLLSDSGEVTVTGIAGNGRDALRLVEEHPDTHVLVLDVSMPVMDGVETLIELRRRRSTIPVLMLTQELSSGTIVRAMKAGASGYVLKTAGREEFLSAIRTVASGGEFISDGAKESLIARVTGRRAEGETPSLTRRELEVLELIAAGHTSNEIGEKLFISTLTVETHRRNLLQKLNLKNVAGLVRYAIEHGLTEG